MFAVLDCGAHLVSFFRMDGARLASNDIVIVKARASVMFQVPSEVLNPALERGKPTLHFEDVYQGGLPLARGGMPLFDVTGH